MKIRFSCIAVLATLLFASPALAQEKDIFDEEGKKKDSKDPAADSDSLADVYDDPNRVDEAITIESKSDDKPKFVRYTKATYPSQQLLRPLVVPEQMIEASFEVPMVLTGDTKALAQVIRGRYGITSDIQIGLTYGVAFETLSPSGFEAGKSFSIDGAYLLIPRVLAVSLRIPINADPFAMGLILGAPVRLEVSKKFAVFLGEDFLHITVSEFSPLPENPAYNASVAAAIATGTNKPAGNLNLNVRALYQVNPTLAAWGSIGYSLVPFDTPDPALPIFVGVSWTQDKLDLGARAGIQGISPANDNFAISLYGAYRI